MEKKVSLLGRAIGKIVREVGKAMNSDVNGNGEAVQIWADGMLALSRIPIVLADCRIQEVTTTMKVRVLNRIVDDMLRLIDDLKVYSRVNSSAIDHNDAHQSTDNETSNRSEVRCDIPI